MLRDNANRSLMMLINHFDGSGIDQILAKTSEADVLPEIAKAANFYMFRANKFTNESTIRQDLFQVQEFYSPDFWEKYIDEYSKKESPSRGMMRPFFTANNEINILRRTLLIYDNTIDKSEIQIFGSSSSDLDIFTVFLNEKEGEASTPERIARCMSGVESIYNVVAALSSDSTPIVLLRCDSGSDKSFDFLGAAALAEQFKEILFGIYDRIIPNRVRTDADAIQVISDALPVFERINSKLKAGKIEREQAELLNRQLSQGVTDLIRCGAIIEGMDDGGRNQAAHVMRADPPLLNAPPEEKRKTQKKPTNKSQRKRK